jgi:hypothetical protein
MPELSGNEESKIRKVIKENALTLIFLTGTVFSFIMFVVIPQQETKTSIALIQKDIAVINTNHLTHLQTYAEEIKTLKEQEAEDEKEQTELMKQIIKIQTEVDGLK